MSGKELAKLISFVPQGAEVTGDFEVMHFLELSRYPYRKPWEKLSTEDKYAIDKALELTDTKKFLSRKIGTLSGGERQRILIAGAIAQDSEILLLDEPVSGLDPKVTAEMYEIIKSLHDQGITIIMISHDVQAAIRYADKILHVGTAPFFGTVEEYLGTDKGKEYLADKTARKEED